jgi:hypothetical protein
MVAKCCQNAEIIALQSSQILHTFVCMRKLLLHLGRKCMLAIFARNTEVYTKFANFAWLYISRILQHFTTKLCNCTHFSILLLAVVIYLLLLDLA